MKNTLTYFSTFLIITILGSAAPKKDIVDTAVDAGTFKTLVAAVKAAGLVDTLKGEGPFTVFAPTDEAFAKLPKGTVESLLKPENKKKLAAILTYHVVSGSVMSSDLTDGMTAAALNTDNLTFTVTSDGDKVVAVHESANLSYWVKIKTRIVDTSDEAVVQQ